ncbi:Uu.00g111330.m01.CDS01 [Anthostomella pinea]|uniref:Uu.00g111330.m01.CDS01 n=1 Tax=Anthostomella pinea TaxID=933095 RepID=A0AAI8VF35_9PEZI|nr:Uu.00g111330.m01.CDS01 [Anthostomella pinea]
MTMPSPNESRKLLWDYIFVGGGLSASVVATRLHKYEPRLKILIVEAGPNVNNRSYLSGPRYANLLGGDFDWKDHSTKQSWLEGRTVDLPGGKALGGSTVINGAGWVRGDKFDYDAWGSATGDARWSYDGQLPFMRKSEKLFSETMNPDKHGLDGPMSIQSVTSKNRTFPLRDYALQAWAKVGIDALPVLDGNAGNPLGVAELQENRENGQRQVAAAAYPLDGIEVMTDTMVEKVLIENGAGEEGGLTAVGILLANGDEIRGREVIVAAGAIRSPQVLMLSGIGPAADLAKHDIPILLDNPEVGNNLADHGIAWHPWKVKDLAVGRALGSSNPVFNEPQYGWVFPFDFVVSTDVPKEGLAAAIAEDEGAIPDPATHPLLAHARTFVEHVLMYAGAVDGSLVTFGIITMLPTARGSIRLASAHGQDAPLIDPNYLGTAVDRYVAREAVKLQIRYAGSYATVIGREILDGEAGAPGFDEVLSIDSTDEYIDARIRAGLG